MLKVLLVVVFVLICIALTVIVLLQEGKSQGLGSISGMADSYWGKNKGRSGRNFGEVYEVCRCCGSFTGVDTEYNLVGYETDTLGNKGVFFYTDG